MANGRKQIGFACLLIAALFFGSAASANPTQQEVFQSISNNLGPTVDGRTVFAVVLTAAGAAVLLVAMSKRQKRQALPQKLNHQGKLMREMIKPAGLTRGEAKTLQLVVQQLETSGQPLRSPLTLMLCPSLTRRQREQAGDE